MPHVFNRISVKLLLLTSSFLTLLAIATAVLVTYGFRQTQITATQASAAGLEEQGQENISTLTAREAQISVAQLQQAVIAGQLAAEHMISTAQRSGSISATTSLDELIRGPDGQYLDPNPDRPTDVFLFSHTPHDATTERDLKDSAPLDTLFPALVKQFPDITAIYYINPRGASRYYPPIGLATILPADYPVTEQPFFAAAIPEANPSRTAVWTPPYVDPSIVEGMVTATTPVYDGDTFRGIIGVDVSLHRLIDNLNTIKPTPNGYAFMVDQNGHLVAAPPAAIPALTNQSLGEAPSITMTLGLTLTNTANPAFTKIVEAMRAGQSDVAQLTLGGRSVFLAYAPISNVGWSLGLVAPVDEVIAQSASVAGAIEQGTDTTIQTTLLTMAAFFLIALLGAAWLSRRLTKPIVGLVAATRAIAGGDLSITIPVRGRDEIATLSGSFNEMIADLRNARQQLERWNEELEATVTQRTAELQSANESLREAKRVADDANAMKSQFLANMSHELRTPLNAIINFSHLALINEHIQGPLSDRQRHTFQRIKHNGEHLLGLINDVLDLAKIEAGRMDLVYEPIALQDLLQGIMATATGLTKDKPIELILDAPDELPMLIVDPTRIRQVLLNLLSNAAKFTEQGTITIHVQPTDDELRIGVEDTGPGIAPEHHDLVFEEFRQVQNELTRRKGGTGLGLPISKRIVEMHGGKMWLESTPGVGSTFWFTLPTHPAPTADIPIIPATDRPGIVIVDDNPADRVTLSSYLEQAGYQVYAVADSRQALSTIKQANPRLIILDILMPVVDGLELLQQLRADPQTQSIPIIVCSITDQGDISIALGANDYLSKPFQDEEVTRLVKRWLTPSGKVLIVDDDADARSVLRSIFEMQEYMVEEANDGIAALECVQHDVPDLIILDLLMPNMDGFTTLAQLRENPRTLHIPVVISTAKMLSEEDRATIAALNARVAHKPLTTAAFVEYVEQLCGADALKRLNLSRYSVAVVDDVEENLHVTQELLETTLGVGSYIGMTSGQQLLDLFGNGAEHLPDLVLMDIQMPDMDGYMVLSKLRQLSAAQHTKVVALTANVMPEHVDRAREAGFDGFIGKPIVAERFLRQVPRILVGEAVWEPR